VSRWGAGERLALAAGACATVASVAGFVPGVYHDPAPLVAQSHGQDLATLVFGVPVLMVGLRRALRGSVRGRLVAIGALGYLLYTYVVYAFDAVLNPATLLYIGVVGCATWSLFNLVPGLDESQVGASLGQRLPRRPTAAFLFAIAAIFGLLWLGQIFQAAISGGRPQALIDAGWPTSPIYVLDLALVLPLTLLTAIRLVTSRPAVRYALPLLVFVPLLALGVLSITLVAALDGQAVESIQALIFLVMTAIGSTLAWRVLTTSSETRTTDTTRWGRAQDHPWRRVPRG
jgi:hypothetical protein